MVTGAPGRSTYATSRYAVVHESGFTSQTMYPRRALCHFTCGFSGMTSAEPRQTGSPSPPDESDVPTNSAATTSRPGRLKPACSSFTQLECTSPVRTTVRFFAFNAISASRRSRLAGYPLHPSM